MTESESRCESERKSVTVPILFKIIMAIMLPYMIQAGDVDVPAGEPAPRLRILDAVACSPAFQSERGLSVLFLLLCVLINLFVYLSPLFPFICVASLKLVFSATSQSGSRCVVGPLICVCFNLSPHFWLVWHWHTSSFVTLNLQVPGSRRH